MSLDNNTQAFLALVRAGLWDKEVQLEKYGKIDFEEIYRLAGEQSVIGLVTAGIEHIKDVKAPQEIVLQCIGESLHLEQTNKVMNQFIAELIEKMCNADIYTLLVKGQGIAQCYERPLWRSSGDVDLFLSDSNYDKAKEYLSHVACAKEPEGLYKKHLEMTIGSWIVELHGSLRCGLSKRMDKTIDELQREVFSDGKVRSWGNGKTQVFLPGIDCDVLFVFTHYIKHFYTGGLGLRQICDWCRLLWTYRSELDLRLLESRIHRMGLMSEWRAFAALAVDYLGMQSEAMPLYTADAKWKKKASRICDFVMEVGNMGRNRDMSYFNKYPYLVRKVCSFSRRLGDLMRHARLFPMDSLRFFPKIMFDGLQSAARGE